MLTVAHRLILNGTPIRVPALTEMRMRSTWRQLTDTAELVLPRTLRFEGRAADQVFQVGHQLAVELGFNGSVATRITAYIRRVSAEQPFTLFCEDAAWLLKDKRITRRFPPGNIRNLLQEVLPADVEVDITGQIVIGAVNANAATLAQILQELQRKYHLAIYLRDGRLKIGWPYRTDGRQRISVNLQRHCIGSSLEYRRQEDFPVYVRAINLLPNGKRRQLRVNFETGFEERTLHFYNLSDTAFAEAAARAWREMRTDGLRGTLTIPGVPFAQHGDIVELTDQELPERDGSYYLDQVDVEMTPDRGLVQVLHLGPAAAGAVSTDPKIEFMQ